MRYSYTDAILQIRKEAIFSIKADNYEDLEWYDAVQTKPTEEEIKNEISRLQSEFDSLEYQRLRASEYATVVDQLDALYHGGYDGWKASIDAIKSKYPKPVKVIQ